MMKKRASNAIGGLAMMTVGVALAVGAPARSQTAALTDFTGSYRFSGRPAERQGLETAIDEVADQLNVFIREIARGEMRRRIQPEDSVRIRVMDETTVALGYGDWGPVELSLGPGGQRVRGPTGDMQRVSLAFERGRLIHRERQGEGERTNVFSLSPDGRRLRMSSRIASDRLPDDIRYRLSFRRTR
jgi:hypothetical protein